MTDLSCADRCIHQDRSEVDTHLGRCSAVVALVELVELFKDSLQLVLSPDVTMVVPCVSLFRIYLLHDTGNNGEVVTSSFEGPEKIWMARLVDTNFGAVCQDDVVVQHAVPDQAVQSTVAPVATT